LAKGFPNPFSQTVHIDFTAPQDTPAVVRVYDVRGRLVTTVFDGTAKAGPNSALWDGRSDSGERVAAGVYFVALDSPKFQASGKVVYIK
jgi:flagellar hook assembly protein FlgD